MNKIGLKKVTLRIPEKTIKIFCNTFAMLNESISKSALIALQMCWDCTVKKKKY